MKRLEDLTRLEDSARRKEKKSDSVSISPIILILGAVIIVVVLAVLVKVFLFPSDASPSATEVPAQQEQPVANVNFDTNVNISVSTSVDDGTSADASDALTLVPEDTVLMAGDPGDPMVFGGYLARESVKSITFVDGFAEIPSTAWDVSSSQNGSILAWVEKTGKLYNLYLASRSRIIANENCSGLFSGYKNATSISFSSYFDTGNVVDMSAMFKDCESLKSLDLGSFHTGKVEDMSEMFAGCGKLADLNVDSFDMSHVARTNDMFSGCPAVTVEVASQALEITPD